jgi:hypothetical protein
MDQMPATDAPDPFAQARGRVDGFVGRHLTWPGTLRLHAAALGGDLLRAPINVVLAPLLLLVRAAAWVCRKARFPVAATRLARWSPVLRTAVATRVEAAILSDLLGIPLTEGAPSRAALTRAILSAPPLGPALAGPDAGVVAGRMMAAIADYSGTRSAIAEATTALCTLIVGAVAFEALTPGMISMAPGLAQVVSHETAVADFPLGQWMGGVWYGVFPVGPTPALVALTVVSLVLAGSVIAAFAGVIADPAQARLGTHRRRLLRLIDTLHAEATGGDQPFATHEHYLVRLFDLWDAALSLLRALRN